ncbi:LLM class flavin-dependent oxidoreductase [Nocardioides sp. cx-169]|uniref:LLM class flavin-dependent oxidoreductase n=1 Tax=Nocardioides sp. cx-169 TaxID=2899080 RepID=UPI001E4DBB74|nr:LLM class flavin-dependent oxidoreductase [Nocardioides sp. cx-169]MCD4535074.1 LLM class flavin-dependent oxidoreductase [Nocardioides sp. cx-169]
MSATGGAADRHPQRLAARARLGVSLPHRWARRPADLSSVGEVARQAEALGFADLWVTENTTDHATCLDPVVALTHAAAVTSRIGLGVSVVVLPVHHPLHVAHQWACLDALSGGRVVLGVGLGREAHLRDFGVATERPVRRFLDGVQAVRALWAEDRATVTGELVALEDVGIGLRPSSGVGPPLWFGGMVPASLRRAARYADGWMASGHSGHAEFAGSVAVLGQELSDAGRDPSTYPISKRVFLAVDDDPARAEARLRGWFAEVYRDADRALVSGVAGRPGDVAERLHELVDAGATHLVLNPVGHHAEQVDALAELAGLR